MALRVSAAGSKHWSRHSTPLLHLYHWVSVAVTATATSPQHQAGCAQVHILPSVRMCAGGLMSITAPLAQEDPTVPGGEDKLMGGDIKAGTRGNKEWEKNSLSPPLEDVLPSMQDSGNNRECETERDAQACKEVSYPWAGKPVFCFLFGLVMHFS